MHEDLDEIVAELNSTPEPDHDLCGRIGAGPLENLIVHHGEALRDRVESLARSNLRFRRALRCVWAFSSPEYEWRMGLLEELGEFWTERVEFVASRVGFEADAPVQWRAFVRSGQLSRAELAGALRSVADWLDDDNRGAARG